VHGDVEYLKEDVHKEPVWVWDKKGVGTSKKLLDME
jgi:hypothetical protein